MNPSAVKNPSKMYIYSFIHVFIELFLSIFIHPIEHLHPFSLVILAYNFPICYFIIQFYYEGSNGFIKMNFLVFYSFHIDTDI